MMKGKGMRLGREELVVINLGKEFFAEFSFLFIGDVVQF